MEEEKKLDRQAAQRGPLPQVEVTTRAGTIIMELEDDAPITVAHFLRHAELGNYDALRFGPVSAAIF